MFSVRYHAGFRLQAVVALLAWLVLGGLSVLDDMAFAMQPNSPSVFIGQTVEPDNDETKVFNPQDACPGGQMAVTGAPFPAARSQFDMQCSMLPGAAASPLYQLYSSYRI